MGVQGLWCNRGQANPGGLTYHLDHDDIEAQAAAKDHIWVLGLTTTRFCVDILALVATKEHTDTQALGYNL